MNRDLRILLFTVDDFFYVRNYLFAFIQLFGDRIVGFYECKERNPFLTIQEFLFICGTSHFAYRSTLYIWRRFLSSIGKGDYSVINHLRRMGVKRIKSKNMALEAFVEEIRELQPDLLLSVGNNEIIPKQVLKIPLLGAYNAHCSILPEFRGILTAFWILLKEAKEVGVTIHRIGSGIDDGPIALQHRESIGTRKTMDSIYDDMTKMGGKLLVELVSRLEQYGVELKENEDRKATTFGKPTKKEIREFRIKGYRFC